MLFYSYIHTEATRKGKERTKSSYPLDEDIEKCFFFSQKQKIKPHIFFFSYSFMSYSVREKREKEGHILMEK
jgi:hypothetical protein